MPASFGYNTYAPAVIGGADESIYYSFSISPAQLQLPGEASGTLAGVNTLAVEVHQANAGSSDVSFDAELTATLQPTATTLARFRARARDSSRVRLKWVTANELNVLGFNIWRSTRAGSGWQALNTALVPAQKVGQVNGARYRFVDRAVASGDKYFYQLEVVRAGDSGEWSEVVRVKVP
jgi:hypothetical protein